MSSATRPWLTALVERLESRNMLYVALRINKALLSKGNEIDLLVHPSWLPSILYEIGQIAKATPELHIVSWRSFRNHAATVSLSFRTSDEYRDFCQLDIRSAIHKHRTLILDAASLDREDTVWDPDLQIRRLTDPLETALLLIRNAIDQRPPKRRHTQILSQRATSTTYDVVRRLGFDPEALRNGKTVRTRNPSLLAVVRHTLRAFYARLGLRTSGLNIVLYGPDGVGKSTQGDRLAEALIDLGVQSEKVRKYHTFVPMDQLASRPVGRHANLKRRVYRRARLPPAQIGLLVASYLKRLPILIRVLRSSRRKGVIAIHDRYLFDVFLKFQKAHGRSWPQIEVPLSYITPPNDAVFVLRAQPKVIQSRSQELTYREIVESYALLDRCLDRSRSQAINIDATDSIDSVADTLLEHVVDIQTERFSTQHRG